jgi:alpha-2-macroglobulin
MKKSAKKRYSETKFDNQHLSTVLNFKSNTVAMTMKTVQFVRFMVASAAAAALVLYMGACKRQQLVAKKMTAAQASYVYAYTAGSVAKETPIRVRFTGPLVASEKVGTPVENGVLSLNPSLEGTAVWEDDRTIRFIPAKAFESNGSYLAKVKLNKLFKNVPSDAETFEFDFKTRRLHFEVETDGIEPENANDMAVQQVTGTLTTSDPTDNKALEKVLTVEQNGKSLTVNWLHSETSHRFIAKKVQRTGENGVVKVSWNGKSVGANGVSGSETVEVPALGVFKVTNARVKHDAEQYIQIHFSDPVHSTQDYKGLITFNGESSSEMRFSADGNNINAYPAVKKSGKELLNLAAGIKNNTNKTLTDVKPWTLEFDQDKPKVRVLGRGVIMPSNDGLQFPFEAINLNAVHVEVFKIFNNNVLQFLQTNDLTGGRYGLEHVGRVVVQKRIPLSQLNPGAKSDRWTRYAVDLSKLIKADPQAIYQIRIGFKEKDTNLSCKTAKDETSGMAVNEEIDTDGDDFRSILNYYGENHNEEGQTACGNSYDLYGSSRFISRNVIASNLGIIAKRGNDGSTFVVVSDLLTTEPKKDVKLEFIDGQNQILATTATDANGTARVEVKGKPYIVIARVGDQQGYLPISDANSLNLSRFDVSGDKAQKGLKGYLYGERGVWRPGDSLYLNFVLEDKNAKLPENYPIQLELYDSKGILQHRSTAIQNIKNLYSLHVATRPDAPTGTWRADVKVGGATFSQPVKIETVKPNRLKINLDFGKKDIAAGDEKLNGTLQLNWLHGAVAKNLKAKVEVVLNSVPTKFDKYKEYVFDAPTRSYKAEPQVVFDAAVNENGLANVSGSLPKATNAPGKMKAGFKIRAFEAGGDFSSDYFVVDYSPFQAYAGVKIPKNKYGEKRLDINKAGNVPMVCVDKDGKPLSNRTLDVNVYRVDWRWWWENGSDDQADFSSGTVKKILQHETVRTDGNGVATLSTKPTTWGRYMVFVTDAVSGHSTGDFFYAGYPWDDEEESNEQSRNAAAMLNFSVNKTKFAVGDNIELNIPTAEAGRILVSIENGSKVLSSEWISVKSGGMTKYSTKATSEMAPTAYAFISVVQPHNQVKNDLPIRMYGVEPLHVEDAKSRLEPIVKCPDVLKPEEKVTIEVSEKSGKAMAYTIAIVDDGLLDLTRFKTPNPWDVFYAREALGVQTFDLYDQVLGAQGGQLERILNIGGDGFAKPKNAQKANRFKPVVMNLGPFYMDGGSKKHTVTIPNYVGSVRAMVVATNGSGAYGSGEKTMPVRKPLMVLATLPRVLGPGEQLKLPVNVFAMEDKIKNVTVKVEETTGRVTWAGETSKSITFSRPGDEIVSFDFKMNDKIGIAKFKVTATGNGESATEEIEMEVRNPNPMIVDLKETVVQAGQSWDLPYNALGTAGTNEATLEVSNFPPIDMARRLTYLLQYPHGCVEQTTSSAFPQLFVDKVLNLNEEQKKQAVNNVKAAIERLKQFQHTDGGFGYWPGDETVDSWATSYVGHFLLEAKTAGYALPPTVLERWTSYQQRMVRKWSPPSPKPNMVDNGEFWTNESAELNQTYRLYTLALAGQAEQGAMNSMRERKSLGNTAKWRLAAAYAKLGKFDVSKEIIANASTEVRSYREMSYTYGSDLRDQAMILETLTLMKEQTKAFSMLQIVSRGLSSGDWYSTQATAYGLMAAAKFAGGESTGAFSFNYDLDGKTATANSKNAVMQVKMPADGSHKLGLKNTSKGQLFVRVVQRGQPATGDKTVASNNLKMNVTYKTLKGSILNPAAIPQGTDFIAEVTVTNPGLLGKGYKEMALTQTFPSGWEIHNARMDRLTTFSNTSVPEYQDIRDDRVLSYFDIAAGKTHTYRVQLNAAYLGKYYLPTTACEAMYDNTVSARQPGLWVEVVPNVQKPM